MRTHGCDTHTQTVHNHTVIALKTQNFVGLGIRFPFLAGLPIAQIRVNPRDQRTGKRNPELRGIKVTRTLLSEHLTVNLQDRRCRIVKLGRHLIAEVAELPQNLAHMAGAAPRSRLIGHRGGPFHQTLFEETTQPHEQA